MSAISRSSSVLQTWTQAFGADYVSVALSRETAATVLRTGLVKPPEERLRNQEIQDVREPVSEEKGFSWDNFYKVTRPSYAVPSVAEFWQRNPDFQIPRDLGPQITFQKTTYRPAGEKLYEIVEHDTPDFVRHSEVIDDIGQRAGLAQGAANVLYDMLQPPPRRIYSILTTFYSQLCKTMKNPKAAFDTCLAVRNQFFQSTNLLCQVPVTPNSIRWGYGDVVILRGEGKKVIGSCEGDVSYLLAPWQNGGKFFDLNLKDRKTTLVLGPRSVVNSYQDQYCCAAIEDLTTEQQDFFQVPARLRGPIKV